MQIVATRFLAVTLLANTAMGAVAQTTTQITQGGCSPNASQIIASTFICIDRLSQEQQKQLSQVKAALEQIVKTGGPIQQKILLRLHTIATNSDRKFEDLSSLYQESLKAVSTITPQLNRIEDAVSELSSRYYLVNLVPITPVPNLDPPLTVKHLHLAPPHATSDPEYLRSNDAPTADILAKSACGKLTILPELQLKHLELLELIANTESIDCNEKQYWYDILPSMTAEQIARLLSILNSERKQIADLNLKYQTEIGCLNIKHNFQWSVLQVKKKDPKSGIHSIEVQRAAVELMESDCPSKTVDDSAKVIETLKATEVVVLAAEPAIAHLLSRLYSIKEHKNKAARVALLKIAYEREPDNWEYFSDYLRHSAESNNWAQSLGLTKLAITRNTMPELRVYSEKDIGRKLWIYWHYLYAATELGAKTDIANAAIVGYNLTKLLLERSPSEYLLDRIAFFSGHIWRSDVISHDLKGRYFTAIQQAAETMQQSSQLTSEAFASRMLNLSWYCLVARAPDSALRAADAGLIANPAYIELETNRAHALVLLGKSDAAFEIYRKYSGFLLRENKTWNEIVVDDFEKLEKLGVPIVPRERYVSVFSAR